VRTPAIDQVPETPATDGVDHQVHARLHRIVEHAVLAPGIEDPAFARGHVDRGVVAFETHGRLRDDGDVHAHALGPVIALVRVARDFGMARQAHQPAASNRRAEAGEHLRQVRAAQQFRRRTHRAGEGFVVGFAIGGHQRQHRIACETLRVRFPGALAERGDFRLQRGGIEAHGQLDEGHLQFHRDVGWEGCRYRNREAASCQIRHIPALRAPQRTTAPFGAVVVLLGAFAIRSAACT